MKAWGTHLTSAMVQLLLLLLLAWVILDFWQAMNISQKTPSLEQVSLKDELSKVDVEQILRVPLFGAEQSRPKKAQAQKVVRSPLHLEVLGLVSAGEQSAAILKVDGKQEVFFVGDVIQPGVVLHAVEGSGIIVDRHGRLERIDLPVQKPPKAG
ncbi:MAG: hypothetical protein D6703_04955 [Zetaproteobacteria bacterium]|nr:MAG: hypothetical protein D6703_04955 [Zetaproteobacteria bacterium]